MGVLSGYLYFYCKSREAATAIEYGLIASGIALSIFVALFAFGDQVSALFDAMLPAMERIADAIIPG